MLKKWFSICVLLCVTMTGCSEKTAESASVIDVEAVSENEVVTEASEDTDSDIEKTDYKNLTTDKTIKIYDIEDGYMEVPYYPELPQCEYDWSKLNLDGQILSYDDRSFRTSLGIDVSKFQGDIDWKKVAEQGFEFAIIRLGYRGYSNGELVTDEYFEKNAVEALEAGLHIGVYFLSQAINEDEAVEEANYAISEIERCLGKFANETITYPLVFDSEKIKFDSSRTESMNGSERTDVVIAFCKTVENAGYSSALYANSQWLTKELDIRRLTDINIWYADYQIYDNDEAPLYPYPFSIWQYTNKGKVDGINASNGSMPTKTSLNP